MARLVFDLDGTLIDSAPDIRGIANALMDQAGARPLSLSETRRFMGEGVAIFVERMIRTRDLDPSLQAGMEADFLARYETAVDLTHPYPGVRETLLALAAAGHQLGLCTNKPEAAARAILRHLGLADLFESVIGGDTIDCRKPNPAPLRAAFDRLQGTAPLIYIGDSETDAETALRADVPFLLFTEGYRKGRGGLSCNAAFSDYAQLPELVTGFLH